MSCPGPDTICMWMNDWCFFGFAKTGAVFTHLVRSNSIEPSDGVAAQQHRCIRDADSGSDDDDHSCCCWFFYYCDDDDYY